MYTVIRFAGLRDETTLHALGTRVNEMVPGMYGGADRGVPNRFSCSISADGDWRFHQDSIGATITRLADLIHEAQGSGVQVEIDVAIEPEDYSGRLLTELAFGGAFLDLIRQHGIQFVISLYGTGGQNGAGAPG